MSRHPQRSGPAAGGWLSGLGAQAIVWTVLPLALMLLLSVGVTFLAYQRVVQSLVENQNSELARVSADRLSENLDGFRRVLTTLAKIRDMRSGEPTLQLNVLEQTPDLLVDFTNDGGILILNEDGYVATTRPFRPDLEGKDFSSQSYFQAVEATGDFAFSDTVQEPDSGENIVVVAVPVFGRDGNFEGALVGRFYLSFQRLGEEIRKLRIGENGEAYLLDRNGIVLYHPNTRLIGADFSDRLAAVFLKQGERNGAFTTEEPGEERKVVGYSVVPVTGWGLVISQPWAQAVQPAQESLRILAVVIGLGLAILAVVVSLGVRRVTDPIRGLVVQTRHVAAGDYNAKVEISQIREIGQLGMAFNEMVEQIGRYREGIREYVAAITLSQEEERKRIARDLHDDTVQSLIAIGQRLELVKGSLDDTDAAQQQLTDLRKMVTGTINNVRQFSRDLRPMALEDLGLIPALQHLIGRLERQRNLDVVFEVEGENEGLASDLEVALYRIIQEALNNVRKHAQASEVRIRLRFLPRQIVLEIKDNGVGFNVPQSTTDLARSGSFGLMGLQERAQLFGGDLIIRSAPGRGTTLRVVLRRKWDATYLGLPYPALNTPNRVGDPSSLTHHD
ncbi:MAG: cache domain-containing protein [Anaerolineae bacterium]